SSVINILLDDTQLTEQVKAELQKQLPGMQVQTWQDLSPMTKLMSGTLNQMSFIFVFIILLALAFGIINTMLMAVLDRTREIGMLLSIGMNQAKIFGMIVWETLFLSFTGVIVGLVFSVSSITYFGSAGIDLSVISEGINALGFSSHIYPKLDADFYIEFAPMVILIALFSSIFPARRAIKLKPAEAVRGE
ncbi:MAG: ABC transporter permease, partial [Chitinophagaceae bacterium]|nr:ABC transporter permease [Chitinophagaceae bacterium]